MNATLGLCFLLLLKVSISYHIMKPSYHQSKSKDRSISFKLNAVLPGDPLVTGTLSVGVMNAISIYSNIVLARYIDFIIQIYRSVSC